MQQQQTETKPVTWHLSHREQVFCGHSPDYIAYKSIEPEGTEKTMQHIAFMGGRVCPKCAGRARKVMR